jgi:hypothetical protein
MQTVIETPEYIRDAKAARLTESEQAHIIHFIAQHPDAGDEIPGTGGARKLRFAGRGRGKSGGYRVVTFYTGPDMPVFLLNVFAKGDRIDLTKAERNALKAILAEIVEVYRRGIQNHVQSWKSHP